MKKILEVRGLSKIYGRGCPQCIVNTGPDSNTNICADCDSVVATHDVSLDLHAGEILGIMGESGSGKSTVVKMLYFDATPTAGEAIFFDEQSEAQQWELFALNAARQRWLRNHRFGMVYQNPHLGLNFNVSAGGNIAERLLMSDLRHYAKIRGRACVPIARRSRKPAVTTSSERAPFRSSSALVATVVPMRMLPMLAVGSGASRGWGTPV